MQLQQIAVSATAALDALLEERAPQALAELRRFSPPAGSLEAQQAALTEALDVRIVALSAAVGEDEMLRLAHRALFTVGAKLGEKMRATWGVGNTPEDLTAAAGLFYKMFAPASVSRKPGKTRPSGALPAAASHPAAGTDLPRTERRGRGIDPRTEPVGFDDHHRIRPRRRHACVAHLQFLPHAQRIEKRVTGPEAPTKKK